MLFGIVHLYCLLLKLLFERCTTAMSPNASPFPNQQELIALVHVAMMERERELKLAGFKGFASKD
jgi:hypothetical protein